jgi:hypothetical protein
MPQSTREAGERKSRRRWLTDAFEASLWGRCNALKSRTISALSALILRDNDHKVVEKMVAQHKLEEVSTPDALARAGRSMHFQKTSSFRGRPI